MVKNLFTNISKIFTLNFFEILKDKKIYISAIVFLILNIAMYFSYFAFNNDNYSMQNKKMIQVMIYFISLFSLFLFQLLLSTKIFSEHKKIGIISIEKRIGISNASSFLSRILLNIVIVLITITITITINMFSLFAFNSEDEKLAFIVSPNLSMYLFGILFLGISVLFTISIAGVISVVSSFLTIILLLLLPIINSIMISTNATKYNVDDVSSFNNTNIKVDLSVQTRQKIGVNSSLNNELFLEQVSKNIEGEYDFSFDFFFVDEQMMYGNLYYEYGSNNNSLIFENTILGNLMNDTIDLVKNNESRFLNFDPATGIVNYFLKDDKTRENLNKYSFSKFINQINSINPKYKNVNDYILSVYDEYWQIDPESQGRESAILFRPINWSFNSKKQIFPKPNKPGQNTPENIKLYQIYSNIPGLSIFNNIAMNVFRNIYYIDNLFENNSKDTSTEKYNSMTSWVKKQSYSNLSTMFINIFNNFVYSSTVTDKINLETNFLTYPLNYINNFNEVKKLQNPKTNSFARVVNIKIEKIYSPIVHTLIFIVIGSIMIFLSFYVFNKKSKI